MITTSPEKTLLTKLKDSSLFRTYRKAFEFAIGWQLSLADTKAWIEPGQLVLWVPIGRTSPLRLVARPVGVGRAIDSKVRLSVLGLLKAFARQLGEEANRAMVESDHAEPRSLQRAKQFIDRNLREKIHLNDVADAAGICSFQLCRVFKEHTGMTMTEYVSRKRVQFAKNALRNPERPVVRIAEESGFTSLSQFSRNFLKYAGESPTEYRLRLGELEHFDLSEHLVW